MVTGGHGTAGCGRKGSGVVRAGLTAERVVGAAAELADEAGVEGVTVSALARRFGVKDASLYSHIRNLRDLRVRVALRANAELADRLEPAVAGRAGRDALAAFADAYREYALAHPGRYAAAQMPLTAADLAGLDADTRCGELVYAVLRAYGLAEPDLTDAARLLRGTFHGFVTLESAGGFQHPRPTDASWAAAVDALHAALENWPRRSV